MSDAGDPTLALVMQQLGLSTSSQGEALQLMAQDEGMNPAYNNPLATTQRMPGSYTLPGNSAGVQVYPTPQIGALATIQTLQNGNFPNIWALLQQHADFPSYNSTGVRQDLHNWQQGPNALGTGSSDWSLFQKAFSNTQAVTQETKQGNASVFDLPNPAAPIVDWATGLGKLIGWLIQAKHWWQIAFVFGGGIMIYVGVQLMRGAPVVNVNLAQEAAAASV